MIFAVKKRHYNLGRNAMITSHLHIQGTERVAEASGDDEILCAACP